MPFLYKIFKKMSLASHRQWILWPGHPKHSQNHPGLAEGQPEEPLVQGNLASQLKINTKKAFWPHEDSEFCGLATLNTAKIVQDRLKANLKDHWSQEIWPPSSKDCNPLVISCGAKLRERLINGLITPWPPSSHDHDPRCNGQPKQGGCHSCMQEVPVLD
jgi:hypothetical protein